MEMVDFQWKTAGFGRQKNSWKFLQVYWKKKKKKKKNICFWCDKQKEISSGVLKHTQWCDRSCGQPVFLPVIIRNLHFSFNRKLKVSPWELYGAIFCLFPLFSRMLQLCFAGKLQKYFVDCKTLPDFTSAWRLSDNIFSYLYILQHQMHSTATHSPSAD